MFESSKTTYDGLDRAFVKLIGLQAVVDLKDNFWIRPQLYNDDILVWALCYLESDRHHTTLWYGSLCSSMQSAVYILADQAV